MALINCPECGKEISDRAEKCINCGFPLTPVATINDQSFEISWLKSNEISQIEKIKIIREKTHIGLKEAIDFINEYKPDDTVNKQQIQRQETLKPHCPTCGSTDILNDGFLLDCLVWQVAILVRVCVVKSVGINGRII